MDANELLGAHRILGKAGDRSVEVLEAKIASGPIAFSTASVTVFLTERPRRRPRSPGRSRQERHNPGRGDEREELFALFFGRPALGNRALDQLFGMGLALVAGRLVAIDEDDRNARLGRDIGDARAHEAGADDADLGEGGGRNPGGGRAPLPSSCIEMKSDRIIEKASFVCRMWVK